MGELLEKLQAKAAVFNTRLADDEGFAKMVEGKDIALSLSLS